MKSLSLLTVCVLLFLSFIQDAKADFNLQKIGQGEKSGFAIYRSGKPSAEDISELCRLGVEEMMVLSGNAEDHEFKYKESCPSLKVIYNFKQDAKKPLSRSFLQMFDDWIERSMVEGKKIAFRCNCGCHRTGRLAAYYQMKYQGLTPKDAKIVMSKHGRMMRFYDELYFQVDSLKDFMDGRECSVAKEHCVSEN